MVDILFSISDKFLFRHNLTKGSMTIVDSQKFSEIYIEIEKSVQMSGGSVGNTMAGIASMGGSCSYIGKVSNDELGKMFGKDLKTLGITFEAKPLTEGIRTACCLVMITPDGERTLATFLGACCELTPEDIDPELIKNHQVAYLEGYLWDAPLAKQSMVKTAEIAHGSKRAVALTLSDSFCVDRHRESFRGLIQSHIDILFANEQEVLSLYQERDIHQALTLAQADCDLVVVTRGAKGALIFLEGEFKQVDAVPVGIVMDTTGAGDLFAAGFLFGITHGWSYRESAEIGSLAAAEIISHIGARPEINLQGLLQTFLNNRTN